MACGRVVNWIQEFQLQHEGLTQHSIRSVAYQDDKHSPTRISITTTLPQIVMPHMWVANQWDEKDVKTATQHVPEQLLWLACLVHGIDVIPSSLTPCTSRVSDVLFAYRKEAVQSLIQVQRTRQFTPPTLLKLQPLFQIGNRDLPPTNVIRLPEHEVQDMIQHMNGNLVGFHIASIPKKFNIQNNWFIPVSITNGTLFLRRIIAFHHWSASRNNNNRIGLTNVPLIIRHLHDFYIVCDDGVYVCCS